MTIWPDDPFCRGPLHSCVVWAFERRGLCKYCTGNILFGLVLDGKMADWSQFRVHRLGLVNAAWGSGFKEKIYSPTRTYTQFIFEHELHRSQQNIFNTVFEPRHQVLLMSTVNFKMQCFIYGNTTSIANSGFKVDILFEWFILLAK